jgi:hypothetical protein
VSNSRVSLEKQGRETKKTHLLTGSEVDLEELVSSFLEVEGRHNGEVDRTTKVDDSSAGLVVHVDCSVGLCRGERKMSFCAFRRREGGKETH